MRTLNLGILAHVDAGKTTLTERLLFAAGVIDEIGSVDDGSTQTDSLALERQRGITIKAAVVSFAIDDARFESGVTVNLIDTPGHPDFIAEVERVLGVLDGAVLVISAVEGVQSQTRVLMRTLQRLRIPTLIFVNKIDRAGARYQGLLQDIATKLTPAIVPMGATCDPGSRHAAFTPFGERDAAFMSRLADVLAERDDALLAAYVAGDPAVSLRDELAAQTGNALVHPVYFGSAITGAGVDALMSGIAALLPATQGDASAPTSGVIFKVERGPAGEKVAYVRMFAGTVRVREPLQFGPDSTRKVTAIRVFDNGRAVQRPCISAGQIGKLSGLGDIQIGDRIGDTGVPRAVADRGYFAPPTLEAVVSPRRPEETGALAIALSRLAEQDPLINVRQDDARRELSVSLYGEVQKEVIEATLADEFGIDVEFRETTTICVERPIATGEAVEFMKGRGNPFLATIGLRIEPAPVETGIEFRLAIETHGTMPLAFFKAVEDTVHEALGQGMYGWQVTDCIVTMTHSGYVGKHGLGHQRFNKSMSSTGEDFRGLTPLVLMAALRQAGTKVFEPMHRFRLEIPAEAFGATVPVLARLRAIPQTQHAQAAIYMLDGTMPAACVHELQQSLPALTRGEGVLESSFERYEPVEGPPPSRPRTNHNPLDRKEYLLHVVRRV